MIKKNIIGYINNTTLSLLNITDKNKKVFKILLTGG